MSADGPDYDALEAVVAAATPGPWEVQACCPGNLHYEIGDGLGLVAADSQDIADADLIVAAVNALPDLLARARERDELRASHDDLTGRLGFGPGFQEPKADNDTIIAFYEQESRDASEWRESQQWRGECALNGHRDDEDCYEHDPMLILHKAITERDRLRDGLEAILCDASPVIITAGHSTHALIAAELIRTLLDQTANDGNTT